MASKKPNKRVVPRAQSFRLIAKNIRAAINSGDISYRKLAQIFDEEAKRLRAMP